MKNSDVVRIALKQSAIEMNCEPSDFLSSENTVTVSRQDERARKYLDIPFDCEMVCYGEGVVASVRGELVEPVRRYINSCRAQECF